MSKSDMRLVLSAVLVSAVLNVVLSMVGDKVATPEQKMPMDGAASLDMPGQVMHMLVHHNQVLGTSTLIVALVVALSVMGGKKLAMSNTMMKLVKNGQ